MPTHLDHRIKYDDEEEPDERVIKTWLVPAIVFCAVAITMLIVYLARS
jgi:hypothetical protein